MKESTTKTTAPPPDTQSFWHEVRSLLQRSDCTGAASIRILAPEPFWDEDVLPFEVHGSPPIFRVVPRKGLRRESLAHDPDALLMIQDCPDAPGWLVPDNIIAWWLDRHVESPHVEDILLSHALFEHATHPDEQGYSPTGPRGSLIHWTPGLPHVLHIALPDPRPREPDAPAILRDPTQYSAAVTDLVDKLIEAIHPLEIELGLRFAPTQHSPF